MATYVYCPRKSTGAFELAKALGVSRLKKFDGLDFWNNRTRQVLEEGSIIICWGTTLPEIEGIRVLNSLDMPLNKYQEWEKLILARVPSPKMVKPDTYHTPANYLASGYVGRSFHHTGGLDLLNGIPKPDYYTYREPFLKEFRIHSFANKSIRAGQKVPMEGYTPTTSEAWEPNARLLHPWVRSYDGGWKISYDGFTSTTAMREVAHRAVKALGLTFGAVDIAQRDDGSLVVLEVNTAPGIEGNTLGTYVRAINRWIKKETPEAAE